MLGNFPLKYYSKERCTFFFALLFCVFPLLSQEANNISIQYTIYDTEDGLPNQLINCIFQDSKGFVWIATNYGFSRYDGEDFVNYSPDNLNVSFGTITEIHEDGNGNLWLSEISHRGSLNKERILVFNPYTEKIKIYQGTEPRTYYSIGITPEKTILLSTDTGELIEHNGQQENVIYTFEDKRHIVQIIANAEYFWLNSGEKLTLLKRNGEFVREWKSSQEYVIVGGKAKDVYLKETFLSPDGNLEDRILLFKTDSSDPEIASVNRLNIESETAEEWRYFSKEEKFIVFDDPKGLMLLEETGNSSHTIDSAGVDGMMLDIEHVYFCPNGFLWASSISGAYKIQITPSKFDSFLHKEEPLTFSMRSIVPLGDSLYCNTYSGNIIFDLSKKEIVESFPRNDIEDGLSSIKASDACIYTAGTGIAVQQICDNGKVSKLFYPKNTSKKLGAAVDYWAIFEDSRKKIWFGTNKGLFFLNTENTILEPFKNYNQFSELYNTLIFDIIETKTAYWIAAQNGLYKMERGKGITEYFHSGAPTPDSKFLPTAAIYDLHEDEEGLLWLTTFGSGLIKFNPQDFTYQQLTVREGLPHNVTNDILADDYGNLWISTNIGIVCINRESGNFVNFDKSDGLHMDEFNKKSSAKLDDGRLVFGGLNGCVVFHPKDFLEKETKEEKNHLRIVQVIINDSIRNAIDTKQPIVLNNSEDKITFELRLLEFGTEEPASYEWKWKGKRKEFEKLPKNQLHLFDIPAGENTIIFRAKSAKGVSALNEVEVSFSTPPLLSLWQIAGGILVLFTAYFFLFRYKKKKHEKISKPSQVLIIEDKKTQEDNVNEEKQTIKIEKPEVVSIMLSPTDKKWLDDLTVSIEGSTRIGQFSVEDMANEMNLSSRQLNRKVKQLTGITPNQFLRDIKLEKAKRLLETGKVRTVAEASLAVGFEKPDYFSRLFQEKFGKRPVSYFGRKKNK